jgi:hypothetical protein
VRGVVSGVFDMVGRDLCGFRVEGLEELLCEAKFCHLDFFNRWYVMRLEIRPK